MAGQLTRATQQVTQTMTTQQAQVPLQDQAVLDGIREDHQNSRPKATTASYKGPQKEYRDWCLQREVVVNKKPPLEQLDEVRRPIEEANRYIVYVYMKFCFSSVLVMVYTDTCLCFLQNTRHRL
jgi:hypothetical protein